MTGPAKPASGPLPLVHFECHQITFGSQVVAELRLPTDLGADDLAFIWARLRDLHARLSAPQAQRATHPFARDAHGDVGCAHCGRDETDPTHGGAT